MSSRTIFIVNRFWRSGGGRENDGEAAALDLRFVRQIAAESADQCPRDEKAQPGGLGSRLKRLEQAFRRAHSGSRVDNADDHAPAGRSGRDYDRLTSRRFQGPRAVLN